MVHVKFVESNGVEHEVPAVAGDSLMRAARDHGVPGILADCSGELSCGTCHVYLDDAWAAKLGAPSEIEQELLECTVDYRESSRLSCQVTVSEDMDGMVVTLPEKQI